MAMLCQCGVKIPGFQKFFLFWVPMNSQQCWKAKLLRRGPSTQGSIWQGSMQLAKQLPEILIKWPIPSFVILFSNQSLVMYWVNFVATEILFDFSFHQYFCRNGRERNHWYNNSLYVSNQPSWVNVPLFFRYSEMNIFNP